MAVAVEDRQPPGGAPLIDYFGIERLAGTADFAQADLEVGKFFLDEQPPHRRRRAKSSYAAAADGRQKSLGIEPRLVDHEHGGAGIPGREKTAPGMLGPARRGNVQMDIARLH